MSRRRSPLTNRPQGSPPVHQPDGTEHQQKKNLDKNSGSIERAVSLANLIMALVTIASVIAGAAWLVRSELRELERTMGEAKERQDRLWNMAQDLKSKIEEIQNLRMQEFGDACAESKGLWDSNQKTCTIEGNVKRFQMLSFPEFLWGASPR